MTLLLLVACDAAGPKDSVGPDSSTETVDSGDTGESGDTSESGTDSAGDTDSGRDSGPTDTGPPLGRDDDGDGYVTPDDCDDAHPEAHPGGEELPATGIDEDCDGYVDLDAGRLEDADAVVTCDTSTSTSLSLLGYGGVFQGIDLDGDGVGDPLFSGAGIVVMGTRTLSGTLVDTDGIVDVQRGDPALLWGLERDTGGPTGRMVDVVAGSWDCPVRTGLLFVNEGDLVGRSEIDCTLSGAFVELPNAAYGDVLDWSHDLDGDGLSDLAIPWSQEPEGWVIAGSDLPTSGTVAVADISTSLTTSIGTLNTTRVVADLDGDGYDTVAFTVTGSGVGTSVYLLDGDELADGDVTTLAGAVLTGVDRTGWRSVDPGDVDGDGRDDVLFLFDRDPAGEGCSGTVRLFTGLGDGGVVSVSAANGAICGTASAQDALTAAAVGSLRRGGRDLALAMGDGVTLVPMEDFPLGSTRGIETFPDRISGGGVPFGAGSLLLADLDGDGDDDLIAANAGLNADYSEPWAPGDTSGVATIFFHPR